MESGKIMADHLFILHQWCWMMTYSLRCFCLSEWNCINGHFYNVFFMGQLSRPEYNKWPKKCSAEDTSAAVRTKSWCFLHFIVIFDPSAQTQTDVFAHWYAPTSNHFQTVLCVWTKRGILNSTKSHMILFNSAAHRPLIKLQQLCFYVSVIRRELLS